MTELMVHIDAVHARANWGRWIADCLTPHCTNAWMVRVGDDHWDCFTCGYTNQVLWPPDPAAVEYLLSMRPDPKTRNWEHGETLTDLLRDNVVHGDLPPETAGVELVAPASITLLDEVDGVATDGWLLPAILRRREQLKLASFDHLLAVED